MHLPKKGLRVLGIAESYTGRSRSTIAGVVMRKDLRIDGFAFGAATVGGMDATGAAVRMVSDSRTKRSQCHHALGMCHFVVQRDGSRQDS